MRQDIEQTIKTVMCDILRIEPESISGDTARDNTPDWDSTNHITLILALEEEFGITFDVSEIESLLSFADVLQVIKSKV